MSTSRQRRRFQFSLKTFLIIATVVGFAFGWVAYHLNWIRERQEILARADVVTWNASSWRKPLLSLRLFGRPVYSSIALQVVDRKRVSSPSGVEYVEISNDSLTSAHWQELTRIATLFPEAKAYVKLDAGYERCGGIDMLEPHVMIGWRD